MSVKVENVETNVVKFQIEVTADEFEKGLQKAFQKNARKFNVPGFRKGKAPRAVVEKYYGEQMLYEDAINIVCPEAYDRAVNENNIKPVDMPQIDILQIGKGQNLVFTATVTVKPEVKLGDYKGIKIEKKEVKVTEEDIEKEIENIREKNARLVAVEDRPVKDGDTVVIDYEGFVDGKPFEGGKGSNWNLAIGSGQFIEGFEEQLIGAAAGEEREISVTFPEEYHSQELSGKKATFKVKINAIKHKELPAVDDEFAKDVSEFETIKDLKNDLQAKLVEREERKAKNEMENEAVKKASESATVEIPRVMIDKQIESILRDFDLRLRYQGISLAKYLEMSNITVDEFKKQFEDRASEEVRTQLVLEKISEVEGISVSDAEYEEELQKQAKNYKYNLEDFKKHLSSEDIEYIKKNIVIGKTIDFIVENAKTV